MALTQDHLKISDIKNDLILLKDGSASLVLQTSAVNFGLLSEEEQVAIIYSFAGLLNSLSFPIQIVIRSERLDVSEYLVKLQNLANAQKNPLLARMINSYTEFTKSVIKDNEVLDKQFYIVLNISSVELGVLSRGAEDKLKRALTALTPRKEHLVRQLSRVGLKARQLNSEELVKLFYDIYNGTDEASQSVPATPQPPVQTTITRPQTIPVNPARNAAQREAGGPVPPQPRPLNITRMPQIIPQATLTTNNLPAAPAQAWQAGQMPKRTPFIVEELAD